MPHPHPRPASCGRLFSSLLRRPVALHHPRHCRRGTAPSTQAQLERTEEKDSAAPPHRPRGRHHGYLYFADDDNCLGGVRQFVQDAPGSEAWSGFTPGVVWSHRTWAVPQVCSITHALGPVWPLLFAHSRVVAFNTSPGKNPAQRILILWNECLDSSCRYLLSWKCK